MKGDIRIAVMADIHSNFEAFRACYGEAVRKKASAFLFLGDYLGDMANPQATMELLREISAGYPCTFIRGNKENYWIDRRKQDETRWQDGRTTTGMLKYNFDRLTNDDIDFFESMPIVKEIRLEGLPAFTACHGSPFQVRQSMRPDLPYMDELAARLPTSMTICAHFHIQTAYWRKGKLVINPGAIGVPLHSGGDAQFMMLTGENGSWTYDFLRVPYDQQAVIKAMDDEQLDHKAPGWYRITMHLLLTGEVSHAEAVAKVLEAHQKSGGTKPLHEIPEEEWQQTLDGLLAP